MFCRLKPLNVRYTNLSWATSGTIDDLGYGHLSCSDYKKVEIATKHLFIKWICTRWWKDMDSMWIMQRRNWWNIFTLRYKSVNMKGLFCLVKSVGYIFWPDGFHGVWWLPWVSWWRKRKISEGIQETSFGRIWIGKLNMLKWCCGPLTTTVIIEHFRLTVSTHWKWMWFK